jgi:hypothetical protein
MTGGMFPDFCEGEVYRKQKFEVKPAISDVRITGQTTIVSIPDVTAVYEVNYKNFSPGQGEPTIKWEFDGGSIVAGQGAKSVRVKFNVVDLQKNTSVKVTLTPKVGEPLSTQITVTVKPEVFNAGIEGMSFAPSYGTTYSVVYTDNRADKSMPVGIHWEVENGSVVSGQGTKSINARFNEGNQQKSIKVTLTSPKSGWQFSSQKCVRILTMVCKDLNNSSIVTDNELVTGRKYLFTLLFDGIEFSPTNWINWTINGKYPMSAGAEEIWAGNMRCLFTKGGEMTITVEAASDYYLFDGSKYTMNIRVRSPLIDSSPGYVSGIDHIKGRPVEYIKP